MPVLSRTKKIPTLIDGSEYKMESESPDGGTDSAVDYCQALDWTGGPLMVAQWLRYCATNRKVAGSIPDGVTGIFH
jgi:hypothetical protein